MAEVLVDEVFIKCYVLIRLFSGNFILLIFGGRIMDASTIFTAIFIAVAFAGWPIIGNFSKAAGCWVGTLMMAGTTIVVGLLSLRQFAVAAKPNLRAFFLIGLAAILNGFAVRMYSVKATDPKVPVAAFVVVTSILMVMAAPVIQWALNREIPNFRQGAGFVLAAGAIYLLGK